MKLKTISKLWYQMKNRILFIFIILVILPSILFLGVFISSYSKYALNSVVEHKQQLITEINKNIDFQFKNFKSYTMTIYYNSLTREYIDKGEYQDDNEYIQEYLSSIVNTEPFIKSAVMEIQGEIYQAGKVYSDVDAYIERHQQEVLDKKGKAVWIPTEQLQGEYRQQRYVFALARAVNSPSQTIGTLWLLFSEEFFDQILKNETLTQEDSSYYLVAEDGTVVTSNDKTLLGESIDQTLLEKVNEEKSGNFSTSLGKDGREKLVIYSESAVEGWKLISLTDKQIAFSEVYKVQQLVVAVVVLYFLFLLAAYYMLSKMIFSPLGILSRKMRKIPQGVFEKADLSGHKDEIDMLIESYNCMTDKIKNLIQEVREEEKAKNDEKLKVLAMQISPHFLYNTLNTIRWMAVANRQTNIKKMVESLIQLMKSVTYNQNDEIRLEEEISLLECYSYIQQMRFQNFKISYEIPEELKSCRIGKLILQPFVENCIQYAFTDQAEMGEIQIFAEEKDHKLHVLIKDNGKGFEADTILKNPHDQNRSDHIGIRNVAERIRLNYGNTYGIHINSGEGQGTVVELYLPINKE